MTRSPLVRLPLLLLGTGSAAAYVAFSLLVTGHIPRSTGSRTLVAVERRDEAEIRQVQEAEAANASAQQTVTAAASRLQAARSTVLNLQQQLARLQKQMGASSSGTTGAAATPPVVTALPPASPVASPPPVISMPLPHTTTGAS